MCLICVSSMRSVYVGMLEVQCCLSGTRQGFEPAWPGQPCMLWAIGIAVFLEQQSCLHSTMYKVILICDRQNCHVSFQKTSAQYMSHYHQHVVQVMTEQTLRQQSVCCANRCRHCPFGHYKVPPSRGNRINTIMVRIWLDYCAFDH